MEGTTTLADALLGDLDDLMDSDDEDQNEVGVGVADRGDAVNAHAHEREHEREREHASIDAGENEGTLLDDDDHHHHHGIPATDSKPASADGPKKATSMARSKFLDNPSLQKHLKIVREHNNDSNGGHNDPDAKRSASLASNTTNRKEQEEENHWLVVQSNKHLAGLAEEMGRAHSKLAETYRPKFPELEDLLPNPLHYKNAVRIIGNETDLTRVNDELNEILSSNQIITISMAGSTTSGRVLTEAELEAVDAAATYTEELLVVQKDLMDFVENSMESLCPSICALIGAPTAAKLLGLAGGLQELTKIPSCNLQVLGQTKVNSESRAGLSSGSIKPHTGLLSECDLIQSLANTYKKKALKVVAAKLALVARFDFSNVDSGRQRSASAGESYRNQLEEKFEKWQEPDRAPVKKALPKPDLEAKKRRGGRRMRRLKERFEETSMMKQANTRAFSTQQGEYGDDAMGITMGLLDTTDNGGAIRKVTEKRKIRQANTKASRKRAMQMAQQAKNRDGLASSVVFTQTTGMELINPEAQKDRVKTANEKWFKNNAGFQSALPKKGT